MPSAQQDLNKKLKLEAKLRPTLQSFDAKLVRIFRKEFANNGSILDVSELNNELSNILIAHYSEVSAIFSKRISPELPETVEITDSENDLIEEALLAWLVVEATRHAVLINSTTQEAALKSVQSSRDDESVRELTGVEAQRVQSRIAARNLQRNLSGRESGILMTETQTPAEVAKATEVEVLTGVAPSIQGGTGILSEVSKEWSTVGDSKVRPEHIAADGQTRLVGQPFTVAGELLRWPGDSTLGASLGNVVNCRCGSIVKTEEVVRVRSENINFDINREN